MAYNRNWGAWRDSHEHLLKRREQAYWIEQNKLIQRTQYSPAVIEREAFAIHILDLLSSGMTQTAVARRYGVSITTIRDKLQRHKWALKSEASRIQPYMDLLHALAGLPTTPID